MVCCEREGRWYTNDSALNFWQSSFAGLLALLSGRAQSSLSLLGLLLLNLGPLSSLLSLALLLLGL